MLGAVRRASWRARMVIGLGSNQVRPKNAVSYQTEHFDEHDQVRNAEYWCREHAPAKQEAVLEERSGEEQHEREGQQEEASEPEQAGAVPDGAVGRNERRH